MKQRRRIRYSASQRAEIWDRWQRGESMSSIGRSFERESSSIFSVLSPSGGIRPVDRKRSRCALSLIEREEISRGLTVGRSLRAIAAQLGRAPSTISREVGRNGGGDHYRATVSDQSAWDRALRPKRLPSWLAIRPCGEEYRASCAVNGLHSRSRAGSSAAFRTKSNIGCHTRRSTKACIFRPVAF